MNHARESPTYKYIDETKILPLLICGVCEQPFINPHKPPCKRHTFCLDCLAGLSFCPLCRCPIGSSSELVPTEDFTLITLLNELPVYCTFRDKGCTWTGPRENLQEHKLRCCNHHCCRWADRGCTAVTRFKDLPTHEASCGYEDVACEEGCGQIMERRLLQHHLEQACPIVKYKVLWYI